jgi:CheY-like chemotaxis protein
MPHTLLLADDSITIQRVIELTFADEDISVITVGNGRAAIERAERDHPDIVLADVSMPERDGYEVASFVKSHPQLSHVPVVLLTGAFEPVDESRARAAGCDGVLVKPFEPQMVIHRVKDLLAGNRPESLWSAGPAPQGPVRPAPAPPRELFTSSRAADVAPEPRDVPASAPVAQEPVAPPKDDPLEAYFDRLDAAVTARGVATPRTEPPPEPLAADAAAQTDSAPAARPIPAPSGSSVPSLADAFAALLNAEGRTPYSPQPSSAQNPAPETPDAEALIDAIAGRVLARLEDSNMRALVLEAAERLVREEIEKLKRD